MKISIFGLGYVGCVGLGCLAELNHSLIGVDINENKVALINDGKATIVEKDIDDLISKNREKGKIFATTNFREAVFASDVAIICVGTPNNPYGHLDMTYIEKVSKQIGEAIKEKDTFYTIAIRSTVMPGTNDKVSGIIEERSGKKRGQDFGVVSNPEFLREGSAVDDFFNPPYTIVASDSEKAMQQMEKVYNVVHGEVIRVSIGSAELIKFINNSFHALKVVFGNEVGRICKNLGVDSWELMDLFKKDKILNISPYYLKPGFSYGGSCLPKDLKALNTIAHDYYIDTPVLSSILNSNDAHIDFAYKLILKQNKKNIGFYNISFKPGTDDLRFSPSLELVERFIGKGYNIKVYDKNVHLSKLSGKNKEYLLNKLPHIDKILVDAVSELKYHSDLIVITNTGDGLNEIFDYTGQIIDLARIEKLKKGFSHYEGICW